VLPVFEFNNQECFLMLGYNPFCLRFTPSAQARGGFTLIELLS